jgi:hypothetical protein
MRAIQYKCQVELDQSIDQPAVHLALTVTDSMQVRAYVSEHRH